ncbi:hypothetical protein EMPG_16485 [Blastomyces silverae]|uniref:Uncharacterized protein n=1 Tax=Blastomyces silverae TaxID=2060906 RepID=A0A0H1B9K6_9EURO|nr:hypothetical protein EMPG_16485 [Blastomyces silverae]
MPRRVVSLNVVLTPEELLYRDKLILDLLECSSAHGNGPFIRSDPRDQPMVLNTVDEPCCQLVEGRGECTAKHIANMFKVLDEMQD